MVVAILPSPDEIRAWIAQGEGQTVELKGSGARPIELAARICGFANAEGGWVIMGADDASYRPVGVRNTKYAIDNLYQALRRCQPPLMFALVPTIVRVEGHELIIAYVPTGTEAVYQAGGVFWVRKGSETVPLTWPEIQALSFRRGLVRWDAIPMPGATLDDFDADLITAYLAGRSPVALRHLPLLQALVGLGAAVAPPDSHGIPTHAGLLIFGRRPQTALPQAEVECVEWRPPGRAVAGGGRGGWLDRRRLDGPIPMLIDAALQFVAGHIPTEARIVGAHRQETPLYPLEAVREAITNAVIHRDYSQVGQVVRVFLYPETQRLEVRSPGPLLPGVPLARLQAGEPLSKPRNPGLVALLRDHPGGYCERLGSGIRLMIGALREAGLPPPAFEEIGDEFVVTFFGAAAAAGGVAGSVLPTSPQTRRTGLRLADTQLQGLNARQLRILEFIQEHQRITNAEARSLTGVTDRTAGRDLADLLHRGLLEQRGGGKSLHYIPAGTLDADE